MEESFGGKEQESLLYWMNGGKRKAVWHKYYDKMKGAGERLKMDSESTSFSQSDQ